LSKAGYEWSSDDIDEFIKTVYELENQYQPCFYVPMDNPWQEWFPGTLWVEQQTLPSISGGSNCNDIELLNEIDKS
jgi:hypothetical protein